MNKLSHTLLAFMLCSQFVIAQNSYTVLSDYVSPWPMDLVVGNRGGIQIFDQNQGQLYYPFLFPNSKWIYNSVMLSYGNRLIASNANAIQIEDEKWNRFISNVTDVSGFGSRSEPWLITQELRSQSGYGVDVHYYYVNGDDFFTVYYEVIAPDDNNEEVKLFHILDTFLGGNDTGPAYVQGESPNYNVVGTLSNSKYIAFGNPDREFTAYGSHNWYWLLNEPMFGEDLQNILDFDPDQDNAIGAQWTLGNIQGKQEAIGTHLAFAPDIPVALPVEWVSFNAENEGQSVQLEWVTASEVNNDYFEIQRSKDGINWESVDIVYGAGYSNSPIYYSAYDHQPMSGETYYRVSQTDFDGTIDYSEIDVVFRKSASIVSLFPNPGNGAFQFDIIAEYSFNAHLEIIDMNGNLIYQEAMSIDEGYNMIMNNFMSIPAGTYILRIKEQNGVFRTEERFVII